MRKAKAVALVAAFVAALASPAGAGDIDGSGPRDVRESYALMHEHQAQRPVVLSYYVVQPGDTLTAAFPLRWRYVCTVNVANDVIPSCDQLQPGDVLDRMVTAQERAAIDRWMAAVPRPKPRPVVRVNAAPAPRASEPENAQALAVETPAYNGSGSYAIPTDIVMCESGGNYKAENPTSTASGAYQIVDGTWGGYGGYSHASDAPPSVQDERAAQIWAGGAGRGNWVC